MADEKDIEDIPAQSLPEILSEAIVIASAITMVKDMKKSGQIHSGEVYYDSKENVINIDVVAVQPVEEIEINILISNNDEEDHE